jgi:hypothetical protein
MADGYGTTMTRKTTTARAISDSTSATTTSPATRRPARVSRTYQEHAHLLLNHYATEEADSGLRSVHGALVDMCLSGGPSSTTTDRTPGDRRVNATTRHREVRAALAPLSIHHRAALYLAHAPHRWPAEVTQAWAPYPGVCLIVPTALSGWAAEVSRRGDAAAVAASPTRELYALALAGAVGGRETPAPQPASHAAIKAAEAQNRGAAMTPGEWLRSAAAASSKETILREARGLLTEALRAFAAEWKRAHPERRGAVVPGPIVRVMSHAPISGTLAVDGRRGG